ncbi:MAG: ABC transporter ATP-binding protein [Planctomycetota bacterium]|nr:ABC transporter ATP-binding protein [Planctomycetota bacterium]
MTTGPAIQLEGLSLSYGDVVAVDNVSLDIPGGEIHCLLGASGSGKSTLLRIIAGLERQGEGSVTIGGEVVSDAEGHTEAERRPVGFVLQDYALFPHLDALENVLFGMPDRKSAEAHMKAEELFAEVGLSDRVDAMPHTLSGGEQQRVALARSMARSPKVMLLDEPFSSLDAQLRAGVRETTLRILREAGVATVMVTHDPAEALSCGDRVSILREGKLIQTGSPEAIYHHPCGQEAAETFGVINRLAGESSGDRVKTSLGEVDLAARDPGCPGTVLLRPEQLVLVESGDGGCRIDRIFPEGSTTLYLVQTAEDERLYVRMLSTETLPEDSSLAVRLR